MNSNFNPKSLSLIALNPKALSDFLDILKNEINMPNIPMPTMGGQVFWTDLCTAHGWRVQQHMITKHARILDNNDVRIAWGTANGMISAFERFANLQEKYN